MSSEYTGAPVPRRTRSGNAGPPAHGRSRDLRRATIAVAARLLDPLMRRLAGRRYVRIFALVQHRGRRSGRVYTTPVSARPTADGFIIPLTFGQGADWFRNIQAAGGCVIRWNGADYALIEPEVVTWATARTESHPVERVLVPVIGIEHFVRLHHAPRIRREQVS